MSSVGISGDSEDADWMRERAACLHNVSSFAADTETQ